MDRNRPESRPARPGRNQRGKDSFHHEGTKSTKERRFRFTQGKDSGISFVRATPCSCSFERAAHHVVDNLSLRVLRVLRAFVVRKGSVGGLCLECST